MITTKKIKTQIKKRRKQKGRDRKSKTWKV